MSTEPSTRVTFSWNLPNALTISRIVLVPFFVWALWPDTTLGRWIALVIFVIASITDRYDGHLARKHNLVSNFGKLADPFADKLLTGAAFIMLSWLGDLPWWVTIVILVREWGITWLRSAIAKRHVLAASPGGKAKTVAQIIGICMLLVPWVSMFGESAGGVFITIGLVIIYIALAITIVTGIDYIIKAVKITRAPAAPTS